LGVGHLQKNKEHLLITFYNRLMSVGYQKYICVEYKACD